MAMEQIKALVKVHKFRSAISFLALEIFALIAFSFGDNFVLYGALSLALMLLLVLFNFYQLSVDGVSNVAFFIFPIFMFSILCALGIYAKVHTDGFHDFSTADLVFIPLGLLPISFSGYLLSVDKSFKIKTFLIVIYSAIAASVVINIIVNLVNFGFFYTVKYPNYYMYYRGSVSSVPVSEMAYVLLGLEFVEVKISQYIIYPALLLTSSIALFFTKPQEKKMFIFVTLL